MQLETLRTFILAKKGTTEETPFGPEALVFKVMGKMFALIAWQEAPLRINLKCDPDLALTLRNQFTAVQPGYHMNKKHWNTITLDDSIPDDEIFGMINHSYSLVVEGLKKAEQQKLQEGQS